MGQLMERNKIEMPLRMRMKEYLSFIWNEEKTQLEKEEKKILNFLSKPLKKEFLLASYGQILTENPLFFTNFSQKFLQELIYQEKLKQVQYMPGDLIFQVNFSVKNFDLKKKLKF